MPEQTIKLDLNDLNVLTDKVTVSDAAKQKALDTAVQTALNDAKLSVPKPTEMPTVTIKW